MMHFLLSLPAGLLYYTTLVTAASTPLFSVDIYPSYGLQTLLIEANLLVPGAYWKGTAPFCSATCDADELLLAKQDKIWRPLMSTLPYTQLELAPDDFGSRCILSTQKSLCASAQYKTCTVVPVSLKIACNAATRGLLQLADQSLLFNGGSRVHMYDQCTLIDPPDPCAEVGGEPLFALQDPIVELVPAWDGTEPGGAGGESALPPYTLQAPVQFTCCK